VDVTAPIFHSVRGNNADFLCMSRTNEAMKVVLGSNFGNEMSLKVQRLIGGWPRILDTVTIFTRTTRARKQVGNNDISHRMICITFYRCALKLYNQRNVYPPSRSLTVCDIDSKTTVYIHTMHPTKKNKTLGEKRTPDDQSPKLQYSPYLCR